MKRDWLTAELNDVDRAICTYVDKLTRTPGAMTTADVEALRGVGLDDTAIHDVCTVAAYFNYINRIADGLGVDLEPEMAPREM
ncbi:MAG: peroxidase [candidate division Zixibacteria bacterium]|nr:peroxidase [candidate division Zixibacteria bacterium]